MSIPESGPPRPPGSGPVRGKIREAVAIGLGLVLAFAGLAWWASRPEPPEDGRARFARVPIDPDYARYVGSRACIECHPVESAAHSGSGHARTLRPAAGTEAARRLVAREVADPERPGVTWRHLLEGGQLVAERSEAGSAERFLVEYAFGSGRHATTFLSLLDRDPTHPVGLEHRLTEFAHSDMPGLTPGQKESSQAPGNTPHGRVHPASNTLRCFGCHVTVTSDRGPEVLDEATMIPNISCERCHGPGKEHIKAARRGATGVDLAMPPGEGPEAAQRQMRLCGGCHRLPEMEEPDEIRVDNDSIARLQPIGLMQSACYRGTGGRLGCSTCHDPHARTSTDRAAYETTCLSCHSTPPQSACPVSPRQGCVACHMPRRDAGSGMMMSDHWIRVVPGTDNRSTPK